MDSHDGRDLFHIFWSKGKKMRITLGLILLFVFAHTSMWAQDQYKRKYHEFYDEKPVHFGFLFGFASSSYIPYGGDSTVVSPSKFGLQIGGIINYSYNKHFELKSGLNIALYDRELTFEPSFKDNDILIRESTWLEIPLLVKYKSIRRDNHRMYIIGGVKLGMEANVKSRSALLSAKTADLSLEYGFGLERFFQFFKFTPEIRFSHGLTNLYLQPTSAGSAPIYFQMNKMKTHTVTLIFNFE